MCKIRKALQEYVEENIVPVYETFDKAHDLNHVRAVVEKSLLLAEETGADPEMTYVVAAYHDIGMRISREHHNFKSAEALRQDRQISTWFSQEQIELMAQAVEDHSTSLEKEPRSLYGKILYHADKTLDMDTIVKRAFLYGCAHFESFTFEQQVERVYRYVNEKYGESGKMKIWLDIPEERARLKELREGIKCLGRVREICEEVVLGSYCS